MSWSRLDAFSSQHQKHRAFTLAAILIILLVINKSCFDCNSSYTSSLITRVILTAVVAILIVLTGFGRFESNRVKRRVVLTTFVVILLVINKSCFDCCSRNTSSHKQSCFDCSSSYTSSLKTRVVLTVAVVILLVINKSCFNSCSSNTSSHKQELF